MKIDLFKILTFLRSHLKTIALGLLVLCLIYSALIFYYYAYVPWLSSPEIAWKRVSVDEKLYKKMMEDLKNKNINRNDSFHKFCPDPFFPHSTSTDGE